MEQILNTPRNQDTHSLDKSQARIQIKTPTVQVRIQSRIQIKTPTVQGSIQGRI